MHTQAVETIYANEKVVEVDGNGYLGDGAAVKIETAERCFTRLQSSSSPPGHRVQGGFAYNSTLSHAFTLCGLFYMHCIL